MLEFEFRKKDGEYWIEGKAKPCSSKTKMMAFVTREFLRQHIKKGKITIEEIKNEL